jgi:hypothetical protein
MVSISPVTIIHFLHYTRKHRVHMLVMALEVDAIMEPLAMVDRIPSKAELGVHLNEVQGQAYVQSPFNKVGKEAVRDVDKDRKVPFQ